MLKKIFFLSLTLILISTIFGCRQNPTAPASSEGKEYFPNKEGNKWVYSLHISGLPEDYEYTWQMDGTTTFEGKTVQIIIEKIDTYEAQSLYTIDDSKVVSYGSPDDPLEMTLLVFPLSVGKSWAFMGNEESGKIDASIVSMEDITVPAGTFACFKAAISDGTFELNYWYAKNIGLVKREMLFENSLLFSQELKSKIINL